VYIPFSHLWTFRSQIEKPHVKKSFFSACLVREIIEYIRIPLKTCLFARKNARKSTGLNILISGIQTTRENNFICPPHRSARSSRHFSAHASTIIPFHHHASVQHWIPTIPFDQGRRTSKFVYLCNRRLGRNYQRLRDCGGGSGKRKLSGQQWFC